MPNGVVECGPFNDPVSTIVAGLVLPPRLPGTCCLCGGHICGVGEAFLVGRMADGSLYHEACARMQECRRLRLSRLG